MISQDDVWYVHLSMLNMCQISSLVAATDSPVAEFSSFAKFEERKRKSNLLMSFPKIVHQKGSFGEIRKNPALFRFCRPILDIFGLTLLRSKQGDFRRSKPVFWRSSSLENCNTYVARINMKHSTESKTQTGFNRTTIPWIKIHSY